MTAELLAGRYRLEEPIASGGMGEVWRATDTVLGRCVAIKILSDRLAGDAAFLNRFRHEARTMAAVRHPGIAGVYDYGECTTRHPAYLTMAYVEGQPLSRYIAEVGRLDAADTAHLVAQVAAALHAVHQMGVVHRDVKPGNLILRPDGTVVLVDFGVAHTDGSPTLTDINEVVGTALYMAPEQVSKQPLSPATDVYALGTVAYHCLAGHPPFDGDNALTLVVRHLTDEPPPLPADVPLPMRQLVSTAMAKDPADRFPTAAALARAATRAVPPPAPDRRPLRAAIASLASAMTTLRPGSRRGPVLTRRRAAAASAGVLGAFAVGAAIAMAGPTAVRVQTVDPTRVPQATVSKTPGAAAPAPQPRTSRRTGDDGSGAWTDQANAGAGIDYSQQQVRDRAVPRSKGGPSAAPSTPPASPATSGSGSPGPSPSAAPSDSPTATPSDSTSPSSQPTPDATTPAPSTSAQPTQAASDPTTSPPVVSG